MAVLLAGVGAVATLDRPFAPAVPAGTVTDLASFAPAALAAVADWVRPVRGAFLLATGVELLVLAVLLGTRVGDAVLARADRGGAPTVRGALVAGLLVALAPLPLRFWTGWVVATEVGLRTSSAGRWLGEHLVRAGLRAVLVAVGIAGGLALVRRLPRAWPPVAVLLVTGLATVLLLLEPLVTTRLLLQPTPLDDGPVAGAVEDVLARSGLAGVPVLVGDASQRTTAVNAYVTGVGPTRRVVLHDTLLELPLPQVRAVVAHEVAHAEVDDPLRGVLGAATLALPLALLGMGALHVWRRTRGEEPRLLGARVGATAVVAVLVGELLVSPVVNWQSRRVEAAADARAVALTGEPEQLVRVARGFVLGSLADPDPPVWVVALGGSHPTPAQRVEAAVSAARTSGAELPTLRELEAEEAAAPRGAALARTRP